nr:immunoglobulin heavy chain junction region [Mus musculus]MBK4195529.1 immunoglobulin heavy chain junction region [Mus musculus]
CARGEYW